MCYMHRISACYTDGKSLSFARKYMSEYNREVFERRVPPLILKYWSIIIKSVIVHFCDDKIHLKLTLSFFLSTESVVYYPASRGYIFVI